MGLGIRGIHDFKTLLLWLSHELNWNTGIDDFEDIEDITYDFDAKDIHLKPEEFAKISSLKQLRPIYEKQPWGIFAVEFESKRFEVSSLRKILSGLVPKRRNRDHAVWDKKNLLFFCFWGEKTNRSFGAVHFEDKASLLPTIKALYISPKNEDPIYLQHFEDNFKKLTWPTIPQKPTTADFEEWQKQWTSAFDHVYQQTIKDSIQLTISLAEIALDIRKSIMDIFSVETENGDIHELYGKFKKALIHDMTEEQFADMYAQTIVYGLFSARCMSERLSGYNVSIYYDEEIKNLNPKQMIDSIPTTNPFLQNLLKEAFFKKSKLSFDELDLRAITSLLKNTDVNLIIDDFNRQTGGGREDPVIYFYEDFLNIYEKEQKKRRGVYYTPLPVVKFMVEAVDDILKTEFGIKDGLASTVTKTITVEKKKGGVITGKETKEVPAIQILDPAVGTGTFLRQIILQIWGNFKEANKGETKNSIKKRWDVYVKNNLLPRLNGFELMMAPYAVAHMKLALVLLDTEYAFTEDEKHPDRIKVFLTNSLEEADREENQTMMFEHDALAEESHAARETKKNRGINVVIGNPPYSVVSANNGDWILSFLEDYKKEPGGIEKLKEKNPKVINDDYVKFIRYAQLYVERAGSGIVAYITNHSFIDNITFRGMRWNLLKGFNKIYIIDLHGNAKKQETAPDGSRDENVFDIQQGVSINIFIKKGENSQEENTKVYHYDLYGLRKDKYEFLFNQKLNSVKWREINPSSPRFFFVQKNFENIAQYDKGFGIKNLFILSTIGVITANDKLFINANKKTLNSNVCNHFNLTEDNTINKYIKKITYRPFDIQYIYYDTEKLDRPRENVMQHFLGFENIALVTCRQSSTNTWELVNITKNIVDDSFVSNRTKERGYVLPLYLYEGKKRRPNFNPVIINEIEQKLNLSFVQEKDDKNTDSKTFCPLDLFDYIYAVLHSPVYRETYREFLKIDFPRLPYPENQVKFQKLVALGGELRQLHLLESPKFAKIEGISVPPEKVKVGKIRYLDEKVFVNDDFYFDDVSKTAWEFYIGGYQPAQKWLKDRKGCVLKAEDLKHYRKIVLALTETARIMGEIDKVGVV